MTSAVLELDLAPARHRLIGSGHALALKPNTLNEAELEYRRFLLLCRADPELGMPSDLLLAEMLLAHARDRTAFGEDCRRTAGRPVGTRPPFDDAEFAALRSLYERTFGRRLHSLWSARDQSELGQYVPSEITPAPTPTRPRWSMAEKTAPLRRDAAWARVRVRWQPGFVGELTAEAASQRAAAIVERAEDHSVDADGYLTGPRSQWYAYPGPLLRELHEDPGLTALLRGISGLALLPTRAAYVYYERGGHIGLHTDVAQCAATLFLPLSPVRPPPLRIRPDLLGAGPAELLAAARADDLATRGRPVRYRRGEGVLILGSRLPHGRPPCAVPVTLAVLCFDGLR